MAEKRGSRTDTIEIKKGARFLLERTKALTGATEAASRKVRERLRLTGMNLRQCYLGHGVP